MRLTLWMIDVHDDKLSQLIFVYARDRAHAVKKSYRQRKRYALFRQYELRELPYGFRIVHRYLPGYKDVEERILSPIAAHRVQKGRYLQISDSSVRQR